LDQIKPNSSITYRSEVDGLRAVSVILVVLYHAGINGFNGGYIGVDIFFVISGFLITSVIKQEIEHKCFSLLNFYERRFRRIIPALFFVVLFCIFVFPFFLVPRELKDFSESLVALALFSSNFLFWWETGYFNPASESKPLIHTWSLAVEEQFYVFWPLIMLLLIGRKKLLIPFLITILVGSLMLAHHFTFKGGYWATASFYFSITRAWELLAGGLVAVLPVAVSMRWKEYFSWLGVCLLIISLYIFGRHSLHPSLLTAIPVCGAALLLLGANNTTVGRCLSFRPLVQIGLTSYSVYLWHQPLFALVYLNTVKEVTLSYKISLIFSSFIIGYISWRWVEAPFRDKSKVSPRKVFVLFITFSVVALTMGTYGFLNYNQKFIGPKTPPNIEYRSLAEKIKLEGRVCDLKIQTAGLNMCTFGDLKAIEKVILLGDSHAQAISYELNSWLIKNQIMGIFVNVPNCETLPNTARNNVYDDMCAQKYDRLYAYIRDQKSSVILANRWMMKLYPIDGIDLTMPFKNSEGYKETDLNYMEFSVTRDGNFSISKEDKEWMLTNFINELSLASQRLFIVYPIPETGINVEKYNRISQRLTGEIPDEISFPIMDYLDRNNFVRQLFDKLISQNPKLIKLDIIDFLCSRETERCLVQKNKIPFYYDDDHLSSIGAKEIIRKLDSNYMQ